MKKMSSRCTALPTSMMSTRGVQMADRIAVMYLGRIVEIGPTRQMLAHPQHPNTRALLSVVPVPNPRLRGERIILQGETPNAVAIPPGCRFHPRCPVAFDDCQAVDPPFVEGGKPTRGRVCWPSKASILIQLPGCCDLDHFPRTEPASFSNRLKSGSSSWICSTSATTCVQPCTKYSQPSSTVRFRLSFCRRAWCRKSSSPR